MTDELAKKLEQRLNRRSFLRGSGFAAAAFFGTVVARAGSAQDQAPSPPPAQDGPDQDPFKITKKDRDGREYRTCPQCGYNMYRQDRAWTCENCGYSYSE